MTGIINLKEKDVQLWKSKFLFVKIILSGRHPEGISNYTRKKIGRFLPPFLLSAI